MAAASITLALLLSVIPAWRGGRPAQPPRGIDELTAALQASEPLVRARAACELREVGERAAPAIAPLAALLADGSPVESTVCERRWWRHASGDHITPGELAASALVAIGSRAQPVLETALGSSSWIARRNAAWAFGALDDPRAVPSLSRVLRDSEPPVREQAAWALGAIGDRRAGTGLVERLRDADAAVRAQAAWALGALDHHDATPVLLDTLRDADVHVRRQSAWALGAIGDPTAVESLVAALKDRDAGVRRQAAWAIGAIGR